jgi:DNA-binding MarR family transcriptional regulator
LARSTEAGQSFTDLILEVFRLNGLLLEAGDRLAAPSGLTSARWQVLGVADHGPVTVAQVARTMGLRRQSVQQTADALARDGFLVFVDDPDDRRARRIALTTAGRRALRAVEARHAVWVEGLAARVDLRALRATVAALRDAATLLQTPPSGRRRRKD